MAVAPVPRSATVMEFGWRSLKGVSGCGVVTPEAIGYSKLSLWPMISWPCLLVRKARNFWASPWWVLDFRTAAPETSST